MNAYEKVTNMIIETMESGVIPWAAEWQPAQNFKTKHRYTGVNRLLLSPIGTFFLTLKQANEMGGRIKKGSRGLPVVYMSSYTKKHQEEEELETISFLKYYTVFRSEDIEGIEFPDFSQIHFEPLEAAEAIVQGFKDKPRILTMGNQACYVPGFDEVRMPEKGSFNSPEAYYKTLFHELAHATGAEKRINRRDHTINLGFGSPGYAKEELVAELTSAFLCHECGIEFSVENTAAYIQSWLKVLRNDKKMIISAASQAEKAASYILGTAAETLEGVAA